MKYFTPQLFAELNSENSELVDAAERKWRTARREYSKHLLSIKKKLFGPVRAFLERRSLHDAELVPAVPDAKAFAPFWVLSTVEEDASYMSSLLSFRQENLTLELDYGHLLDRPSLMKPVESPVFYEGHTICLYDEFAVGKLGYLSHEILFSNGYVAKITFKRFAFVERLAIEAQNIAPSENVPHRSAV